MINFYFLIIVVVFAPDLSELQLYCTLLLYVFSKITDWCIEQY